MNPAAPRAVLVLIGASNAVGVVFILAAPARWLAHPAWMQCALLAFACATAFGSSSLLTSPYPAVRRATLPAALWASISILLLFFSGYYFSDDALRHIHDGWNILLGNNVYMRRGGMLPMPVDVPLPYADMPTIYLPTMQMFALAGAWISPQFGFLLLYNVAIVVLAGVIVRRFKGMQQSLFLFWILSVGFLLDVSGRHSDILGVMFSLLGLTLSARGRSAAALVLGGLLVGLGVGFKPEGLIFAGYAAFVPLLGGRKKNTCARIMAVWTGGAVAAAILSCFAFAVLWREPGTLDAYRKTLALYLNQFTAYNPFILYRVYFQSMDVGNAASVWRRDLTLVVLGLVVALPGLILMRHAKRTGAVHKRWVVPVLGRSHLGWRLLYAFFLVCLSYIILVRGAWHSWYLEYVVAALLWGRHRTAALFLISALPLWYLPVPPLRAGEAWQHTIFFTTMIMFAAGWFLLTKRLYVLYRH